MFAWTEVAFVWQVLLSFSFLLVMVNGESMEGHHKVCSEHDVISVRTKRTEGKSECDGCELLRNCTTVFGSVHLKGILVNNDKELEKQIRFPRLKEITGHLIVTFLEDVRSLSDILPNLAVIRGRVANLFQDYALVVYQNRGLRSLGLNALTVVKEGGIKIKFNLNLCYLNRVRWESLMNHGSVEKYELSIDGNSKECYDKCSGCLTPSGHGFSGITYCWGDQRNNCQRLCDSKCGSSGCEQGSQEKCCHSECLGGCTKAESSFHCNACQHLRLQNGECVKECPSRLKEVNEFVCSQSCPKGSFNYLGKCVKDCPAGYSGNRTTWECDKCPENSCPRECSPFGVLKIFEQTFKINLLSDSAKLKGCTVIDGNLEIEMRKGRTNVAQALSQDLGSIEEVKGYVVVRQSSSLISLNFFKKLKKIAPRAGFSNRYALAIFDNPNLESLWDVGSNFTITKFGVFIQLNPRLCPLDVRPLTDVLEWGRSNSSDTRLVISETTNGHARACEVYLINITVTETVEQCKDICVKVSWPNKIGDYRNVLYYSIWYRETTSRDINEYDDVDACNSDDVWTRQDVYVKSSSRAGDEISANVRGLSAFTLYAFRVDAFVIDKKGVKSSIAYFRTKETIPSPPLALQVNFLSSDSLQVTWKEPFFPNGEITHYVLSYQESYSSHWWKNDIDWCKNQDLPRLGTTDQAQNQDNGERNASTCPVNYTCNCEKNNQRELPPDKKAALFAKEFQNKILNAVFTKRDTSDNDDTKQNTRTTVSTLASTAISVNRTNSSSSPDCGENGKNSSCTRSGRPKTNTTSTSSPSEVSTTSRPPTSPPPLVFQLNTTNQTLTLSRLKYFTEYSVQVCACNGAGCGMNKGFVRQCSDAVGRTDKNVSADDVGESLSVSVNNETKEFTLTWSAPDKPNGAVLRYDVWIKYGNETADIFCVLSSSTTYGKRSAYVGRYEARVRAITPVGNGTWSNVVSFVIADYLITQEEKSEAGDVKLAAVVGISLAAIVILIIAFAVVFYVHMHKRYQKAKETGVLYASANPEYLNCSEVYIPDEWEVPRDKIKLIRELGTGSFGMVYEGEAKGIVPDEQCSKVAVKTVSDNSSIRDKVEFLKEASIMKAFNCNHVVRLLGVVSAGNPVLVVMELMENGDLKSFLRSRRPDEAEEPVLPPPSDHELCQMAAEIADGMAYLAKRKFVHRDLAARNCMVSSSFICKIGDFGMARDVYETDYYRKGGKGFLPVRWMAPESLKDGIFTSASDVWSFGVVLWEMVTLAEQPYQGKSNEEVMKFVIDGEIMDVPAGCPEILFNLMMNCWQYKPKVRPSFTSIVSSLEQYVSEGFIERSFYHNQRQSENTDSSCVSLKTDKEDLSGSPDVFEISHMDDAQSKESVV